MAINESKIIDAVNSMNPQGNEEGIIDAFGVYLTNHYADYYNKISFRFEEALAKEDKAFADMAQLLLKQAGHVCAYFTFGGIYRSDAWKGLIAPMCNSKEDEVKGVIACINALGWGKWKVKSVNKNKLVVQVKNSYESIGHLKEFPKSKHSECYLLTGGLQGLMDLIYGEYVDEEGEKSYYTPKETKCRCKGNHYCEVVVTRKK